MYARAEKLCEKNILLLENRTVKTEDQNNQNEISQVSQTDMTRQVQELSRKLAAAKRAHASFSTRSTKVIKKKSQTIADLQKKSDELLHLEKLHQPMKNITIDVEDLNRMQRIISDKTAELEFKDAEIDAWKNSLKAAVEENEEKEAQFQRASQAFAVLDARATRMLKSERSSKNEIMRISLSNGNNSTSPNKISLDIDELTRMQNIIADQSANLEFANAEIQAWKDSTKAAMSEAEMYANKLTASKKLYKNYQTRSSKVIKNLKNQQERQRTSSLHIDHAMGKTITLDVEDLNRMQRIISDKTAELEYNYAEMDSWKASLHAALEEVEETNSKLVKAAQAYSILDQRATNLLKNKSNMCSSFEAKCKKLEEELKVF